ncbi:MAG TPA: SPFH domain-containing protein [Actinomycetota bacterium]|nr:SPFH domain-containing protein [Actinomycetota bacterium]
MNEIRESPLSAGPGRRALSLSVIALAGAAVLVALSVRALHHGDPHGLRVGLWVGTIVLLAGASTGLRGLTRLAPGDAVVVQRFGSYIGTLRSSGLCWVNPWSRRRVLSTRIRSHETAALKVNDVDGIPLEVAMLTTWRVADTARALFLVDDYPGFLTGQCEMALRQVAACHRYEPAGQGAPSLTVGAAEVADELGREVARRVEPAGLEIIECQLVRIAYAAEIAHAMLRRQQAAAVVAARQQIVDGAVGMVELALDRLQREHVVELDEERKATMVSNLLVVLCGDHSAQPMVNAGSLYL